MEKNSKKKSILCSLIVASLLCTACGGTSQVEEDYADYSQETTTSQEATESSTVSVEESGEGSVTAEVSDTTTQGSTTTDQSLTESSSSVTTTTTTSTTAKVTTVSSKSTTKTTTVSTTHSTQAVSNGVSVSDTQPQQHEQTDAPSVTDTQPQEQTETPSVGTFDGSDMTFDYNCNAIGVNMDMDSIVSYVGEPIQIDTAPSCYYDGDDKTYIYNDFTIYTYTYDGSVYYSQEVEFTSNTVYTDKGIHIGSTLAEVESAYGTGYTVMGTNYRYYASDDTYFYLNIDQGVVTAIGYVVEIDL